MPIWEDNDRSNVASRLILEAKKTRCERKKKIQENGGTFNIFEILNKERNEVGTHSNMLYSILNEKSEHTMGSLFLELFITEHSYDGRIKNYLYFI